MGSSFDVASRMKSSGDFTHVTPVYDTFHNLYYLPFFRESAFYLKEYRLDAKDTVYSRTERISYIIGSGHHTNSHMMEENGYVFQVPITFYTQKGKWDLPPGFEHGNNTRFSRKIGIECMSCHNALPQYIQGSDNQYTGLPHGISCERCHGPGELHVKEKMQGFPPRTDGKFTIVNPAKLSWQRQIDICQRCHLQGNAVLKPGKDFSSFRPGMVLSETFDQFSPDYHGGEDFVMAAHAERFQKSPCFIGSTKGDLDKPGSQVSFTCISCHNPHVTVRKTNTILFNQVCQSCHDAVKLDTCSEQPMRLIKAGNNCVMCHMPSSGTIDIPHVTVHDHYIRKPVPRTANTAKLVGLRCITNKKPDILTETEAYISYFEKFDPNPLYLQKARDRSKSLDARQVYHLQTLLHLYYVEQDYNSMTKLCPVINPDLDAWTTYRVAKAYERNGDLNKSAEWFIQAMEKAPANLDFMLQYGVLMVKAGQYRKAEVQLEKLNGLYSKNAESWAYLGLAKLKLDDLSHAKQNLEKALSLDPDLMVALQNLKNLYAMTGNVVEEKKLEVRISILAN